MKVFKTLLLSFALVLIAVSSSFGQTSGEEKVMTITIETVDANGEESSKILKLKGDDVDETKVDEIVERHLSGDEKSVNVNVEIDGSDDRGGQDLNMKVQDMEITVDGDKVYINGEEIEEGEFEDRKITILRDGESSDEVMEILEDVEIDIEGDHQIYIIETEEESSIKRKRRAFLGVENGGDDDNTGVVIRKIITDTAAEKFGLKAGDKILKVDDQEITSFSTLMRVIKSRKEGDKVSIEYERGTKLNKVDVVLGAGASRERRYAWKEADPTKRNYFQHRNTNKGCCDEKQDCCTKNASNVNKARLGVSIDDGQGAMVLTVQENSAADKVGLKKGDDIIKLGKEKITSADDLIAKMKDHEPGEKVKVQVLRNGAKKNFKAILQATEIKSCCPMDKGDVRIEKRKIIIKKDKNNELTEEDFAIEVENDLEVQNFDLFPNPTSGIVNFKFELEEKTITDVKIVDLQGKEVFSETVEDFNGSYKNSMDFSNLSEGIYLIQISQAGKSFIDKIIYSKD